VTGGVPLADPTADVSTGITSTFLQLGAIGALALLLLWFAFRVYNREVKRGDDSEDEVRELNREFRDKYAPALAEAAAALRDAAKAMAEVAVLTRERR
jgi:hypothetical protein